MTSTNIKLEDLEVEVVGTAARAVVLVHGSLNDGTVAFQAQRPLAERWRLVIPNRRGYGASPRHGGVDPDVDAADVAQLLCLHGPAHLVGTSMGGVVAGRAAARAADCVLSLTLIEPPAFASAMDIALVAQAASALQAHWASADAGDVAGFLQGFSRAIRYHTARPPSLTPQMERAARSLMTERPWLASIPVAELAALPFPKLLVSGESSPVFEAIADHLAAQLGARRRVFSGAGHAVQRIGPAFNELLESFITEKERA